jgi:hypothetical protein
VSFLFFQNVSLHYLLYLCIESISCRFTQSKRNKELQAKAQKCFFFVLLGLGFTTNMAENMVVQLHKPTWENVKYVTQTNDLFVKVRRLNGT